jgi:flagellar protein FlgJ
MNIGALTSQASVQAALLSSQGGLANPTAAQLAADRQSLADSLSTDKNGSGSKVPTAGEVKKAASQFEAIILRQLLAPTIEPVMSGGTGGGGQSSGGGVYGYMLTDVLANSLAQGGGLGWAKMLEKQLTPAHAGPESDNSNLPKTLPSS